MGDLFNIFDKINDNWREWKSVPYAFLALTGLYVWISLKADVMQTPERLLFLALVFLGIFLAYTFVCAIHVHCEKAKEAEESADAAKAVKNPAKIRLFVAGICVSVMIVIISSYLLIASIADKDGKYVIWADDYRIAMTHNVHKSYYLSGESVIVRSEKLEDYSRDSVFELDFKGNDTFTIAYGDKLLGVTPGQNGVGYSKACTSTLWKLEEVEDGVYYILNVDEDTYLKWYDHLQNWTTHRSITEDNRSQYLICIEKVD